MTTSLVLGVLSGLTTGLLAVGLVLVYKANRFINLAHGQLGVVSAALLAKFVVDRGWSWWAAFPLAVVVGVGVGVAAERFVIRRLRARTSSALTLMLATIGVAQLLLALTYVHALSPNDLHLQQVGYPVPFQTRLRFASVVIDGPYFSILVAVPVVIVGLALFLRFSSTGKRERYAIGSRQPIGRRDRRHDVDRDHHQDGAYSKRC